MSCQQIISRIRINLNQHVADELFACGEANIGVTKVNGIQALKMTTLGPIATLDNVKVLLNQVISEAHRIKGAVVEGNYQIVVVRSLSFLR